MTFRRNTNNSNVQGRARKAAENAPKAVRKATKDANKAARKAAKNAPKAARKAAKNAPPRRSVAIVTAAVIGLIAALVAKRFLGTSEPEPIDAPDVERADATWAPEPSAPLTAPETTST
jgi:ElaB/YqjD/DUF883 family membrane-anchored ribosome-binding protein